MAHNISRTFIYATGTFNTSGNNTVIAAQSGRQIVVKDIVIQNESTTETLVIIKNGSTAIWRAALEGKKSLALSFAEGEEMLLDLSAALVVTLDGANSHGYSIRYFLAD